MNPRSVPGPLARGIAICRIPSGRPCSTRRRPSRAARRREAALDRFYAGEMAFDDPEAKLKWLRHAAGNGDARALNTLGFMYERGEGVAYDPQRAADLYIRALETGDLPARDLRGQVDGKRVPWDRETALEFQRSCGSGGSTRRARCAGGAGHA